MRRNGDGNEGRRRRVSTVIPPEQFAGLMRALERGGSGIVLILGDKELQELQEMRSVGLEMENGDCYVLVPAELVVGAYGSGD